MRHIVLEHAGTLEEPAVRALMREALRRAGTPMRSGPRGRLIIKSVSAKQRARRPDAA